MTDALALCHGPGYIITSTTPALVGGLGFDPTGMPAAEVFTDDETVRAMHKAYRFGVQTTITDMELGGLIGYAVVGLSTSEGRGLFFGWRPWPDQDDLDDGFAPALPLLPVAA